MKIRLLYYFQKNKQKILSGALFLFLFVILLITGFYYKDFQINKKEEIVFSINEEKKAEKEIEQEEKVEDVKVNFYYVDIKGEIKKPGVYVLEEGKRVIDVIEKAGGFTKNADPSVNNLSKKIKDEMVIVIYSKEQVKDFANCKNVEEEILDEIEKEDSIIDNDSLLQEEEIEPSIKPNEKDENTETDQETIKNEKVSLNNATKEQLMTLSGIGAKKAEAIISYREEQGSFTSVEELLKVNGIGEAIFNQIKDFITL